MGSLLVAFQAGTVKSCIVLGLLISCETPAILVKHILISPMRYREDPDSAKC